MKKPISNKIPSEYLFLKNIEQRAIQRLPAKSKLKLKERALASAHLGVLLAKEMGLGNKEKTIVWLSGLLHDIGKGKIWRKYLEIYPESLPPQTREQLKAALRRRHTERAIQIIDDFTEQIEDYKKVRRSREESRVLETVKRDIREHERTDGNHTPTGMIMTIADAYAAYSRRYPYRPKLKTPAERIQRIRNKYSHPNYAPVIDTLERISPFLRKNVPHLE
ncbi:HD domain-containing protein [Candidatus Micrarchaeota archaeon]|nr:HD domain-containing protein [Candidatus Micrarchaeota archaeon]